MRIFIEFGYNIFMEVFMENKNLQSRTDLAIEIREQYESDNVEISGVVIEESYNSGGTVKTTLVDIVNENGANKMCRPQGKYITIENIENSVGAYNEDELVGIISGNLSDLIKGTANNILIVGLGNKDITPDALGPLVTKEVLVNRHLVNEYGESKCGVNIKISAIAPGVMGQTGMEASEIVKAIVKDVDINLVIAIDALAARSVNRLNNTIQITDTGIAPGSGVGNNRAEINKRSIGVPVIAIGVPTVVDAYTIMYDMIGNFLEKEGYNENEINEFTKLIEKDNIGNMFVTPKNMDELIKKISNIIARGINKTFETYN